METKKTQRVYSPNVVLVPTEKRRLDGVYVFQTSDKQKYLRGPDGTIRREYPKENGKNARKRRAKQRHEKECRC